MKILIADDDTMTLVALRKNLKKWGYEVVEAKNGSDAWETFSDELPPRLAILDWIMPEIEGIEICRRLSNSPHFPFIYTILLTSKTEKDDIVKALDAGAYDFLSKPVHAGELRSRIAVGARLVAAEDALKKYAKEMELLAIIDPLTNAYNRRYFFDIANKEIARSHRYDTSLSFILMDIDYFKNLNDSYGHLAGDEVLRVLTKKCKDILRNSDIFSRYGGEEFSIILPHTDIEGAHILAERLREDIETEVIKYDNHEITFTVSIGIGTRNENDRSVEDVLNRADGALYQAKKKGRNQCVKETS